MNIKKLKEAIKNPKILAEAEELIQANKFGIDTGRTNYVLLSLCRSMFDLLSEKGITEVEFEYKGNIETAKRKDFEQEMKKLIERGHIIEN